MAKKRYYSQGDYAGVDARRRQEFEDGQMIKEDHNAMANMPQEVIMRFYPRPEYAKYDLNDDIRGIDKQMDDDGKRKKHGPYPEKY